MCNVKRQHVEFKKYLNKIDSNHNKDYAPAFIDDFLYDAALDYLEMFYAGNNYKGYKLGFEVTQQRIDMLSTLVVPFSYSTPDSVFEEYGFSVSEYELPEDYAHLVRLAVKPEGCHNIGVDITRHNDLNTVLVDAYQKPSNTWARAVAVFRQSTSNIGRESLFVYSETPATLVYGEYLKKPVKPFFGGYTTLEFSEGVPGSPDAGDAPRDMDIPSTYCNLVANMAAQLAAGIVGGINTVNLIEQQKRSTT